MRVVDSRGRTISSLDQWRSLVFDGTSKRRHWKKGRSAHSLAEFIMGDRWGAAYLDGRLSSVLAQSASLEEATPEYLARFDSQPGIPSNLDLGIIGQVDCEAPGSRLFVGVEANVDETFGSTVESRYRSALKARRDGKKTNAPERVEDLLSKYFSGHGPPRGLEVRQHTLPAVDPDCRHACGFWRCICVLHPGLQDFNIRRK